MCGSNRPSKECTVSGVTEATGDRSLCGRRKGVGFREHIPIAIRVHSVRLSAPESAPGDENWSQAHDLQPRVTLGLLEQLEVMFHNPFRGDLTGRLNEKRVPVVPLDCAMRSELTEQLLPCKTSVRDGASPLTEDELATRTVVPLRVSHWRVHCQWCHRSNK